MRWLCAAMAAIIFVSADAVADSAPKVEKIYNPQELNALPAQTVIDHVSVIGIMAITSDTDGPYLYQDMQSFGERRPRDNRVVSVLRTDHFFAFRERYEAALVIITGKYRKSACREPQAVCPHMKGELESASIGVVGYPDRFPAEQVMESGKQPLKVVGADDPDTQAIQALVARLVRAVSERDLKAIASMVDPEGAKSGDVGPGTGIHWRLFDPEAAFVSEQNKQPAFRLYEYPYFTASETRAVAICFDRGNPDHGGWPDSYFDLDAHNVGDPYACIAAAKGARGWRLAF